jgi:hypothetical protein
MATQYTAGLTSGQVLTAATMNSIGAAWETYTPTFTSASSPQPALGNGTLTGRYCRINKLIVVQINFLAGSTTTFGTAKLLFSLPFTNTTNLNAFFPIGFGYIQDASTANVYMCVADRSNEAGKVGPRYQGTGNYGDVSGTVPFTFAVNDQIMLTCSYEFS